MIFPQKHQVFTKKKKGNMEVLRIMQKGFELPILDFMFFSLTNTEGFFDICF